MYTKRGSSINNGLGPSPVLMLLPRFVYSGLGRTLFGHDRRKLCDCEC